MSESVVAAPLEAQRLCGASLPRMVEYAEILTTDGVLRGVIGPREQQRIWERHLLNSAAVLERVPLQGEIADVGSGAGLPGVVIAILRPQQRVHLIEPLQRRTQFLSEVCERLSLDHVTIHRARAQELKGVLSVDCVVSRAVAPLEKLIKWMWPLVAPRGVMLAMKGERASQEIEKAHHTLSRCRDLHSSDPSVYLCDGGFSTTRVVEMRKTL